jgi:hypothetical protein
MVHGDCKSAGCYAMTDAYIEEIYILAREAFNAGQTRFHVQALPFRMTAENLARHRDSPWYPFWARLKEGSDSFDATGRPPVVKVCGKQYLVNVRFTGEAADPAPDAACPTYAKIDPSLMSGVDGVPATVLASLGKAEQGAAAPAPAAVTASMQPAPAQKQTAPVPSVEMSASAVITRPAANPASMIASVRTPKPQGSAAYADAAPPPAAAPAPAAQALSAGSAARPVSYQIGSPMPAAHAQTNTQTAAAANHPTYDLDPNAIQRLDRSGKGGKLSDPGQQPGPASDALSIGAQAPAAPAAAAFQR